MNHDTSEQLQRRAYHHAGHAVAAAMRASGAFNDVLLTVSQTQHVVTDWGRAPAAALPFIAYAGPWSQARADWNRPGLAAGDDAGRRFEDHVADTLLTCPQDATAVAMSELDVAAVLRDGGADDTECWGWVRGVLFAWRADLEDMWPVVEVVAAQLLAGHVVSVAEVRAATDVRLAALYT